MSHLHFANAIGELQKIHAYFFILICNYYILNCWNLDIIKNFPEYDVLECFLQLKIVVGLLVTRSNMKLKTL